MLGKKNVNTSMKRSPSNRRTAASPTDNHKVRNARPARVQQHNERNDNTSRLAENSLRKEQREALTEPISL